jgi:DNA-binding NarL/FixJ family response regulator
MSEDATSKTVHVLLADDHSLVRAGIRSLLEGLEDVEVVAETGDGREALRPCQPRVSPRTRDHLVDARQ